MNLRNASEDQLKAELERRQGRPPEPPDENAVPLFAVVHKLVVDHVNAMLKPDYCDDNDTAHYIYEAAMEAVYGKEIWTWVRQVRK